jgi:hypothetical protein
MERQGLRPQPSIFIPLIALTLVALLLFVLLFPWIPCPTCEGEGKVLWFGGSEFISTASRDNWIAVPKFEMVVDCESCRHRGRINLLRRWQGVPAMRTAWVYY